MEEMTPHQTRLLALCLKALEFSEEPCALDLTGFFAVTSPAGIGPAGMIWASVSLWDTISRRLVCSVRRDPIKGTILFKDVMVGKTFWVSRQEADNMDVCPVQVALCN